MKRLRITAGGAAFLLAAAMMFTASPASALPVTACNAGEFPVTEGTNADLTLSCVLQAGASGNAVLIRDFDNDSAFWHTGAARQVTVSVPSNGATVLNVTKGCVNIAGTAGDVNRTFEAGFGKFLPGTYIKAESGTAAGATCPTNNGTLTISQSTPGVLPKAGTYVLNIENSNARTVPDGVASSGSTVLNSASSVFQNGGAASDNGMVVTGTGIALGTTATYLSATSLTLSQPTTDAVAGSFTLTNPSSARPSTQRLVSDLTVGVGTPGHIFSSQANFKTSDIGLILTGTGIPANSWIASRVSATEATLNTNVTTGAANVVAIIGLRNATAPQKDGVDPVMKIQTEIVGNPALVTGAPPCPTSPDPGTPVGVNLQAVYNSPSKFALKPVVGDPSLYFNDLNLGLSNPLNRMQSNLSGGAYIGQVAVKSSVVEFAGYIQELSTGQATIAFPLVPTGLGQCPNTAIANTFSFDGGILSQDMAPTGYGAPGTSGFRHTTGLDDAGTSVTGTADFDPYNGDTVDTGANGSPVNAISMNVTTDILSTASANTFVNGQVINITCDTTAHCTTQGTKEATAYYVAKTSSCTPSACTGNQFQLSTKPFDTAHSVAITKLNILANTYANTMDLYYGAFTAVGSPLGNSCTIARPVVLTNLNTAFSCPVTP